ncbi:phosphoenolpyruvate--protein phosphotransferase [Candidatus Electronema sp. JM]|uniref:phosphoenolpyruvate--protein phosphotransferase n=1 Tax=Candidatus Electronema sp. JM TaxID=3401571 RepID=UPI003AA9045A
MMDSEFEQRLEPGEPETLHGISGSPGIVVGKVVVFSRQEDGLLRYRLEPGAAENEEARFMAAVARAEQVLISLRQQFEDDLADTVAIVDSHIRMVRDRLLLDQTLSLIRQKQINAEWALTRTLGIIKKKFDHIADDYIRSRFADVEYVARLIAEQLNGQGRSFPAGFAEPVIVAGEDFSPEDTIRMHTDKVLGFLTEKGGSTSHTAIVARSLGLPAVVGVRGVTSRCRTGDTVIVDGYEGRICLHPTLDQQRLYLEYDRQHRVFSDEMSWYIRLASETVDGLRVRLSANIEIPDVEAVIYYGASGIGLFRSEFGYLQGSRLPDEESLFTVYRDMAAALAPEPVTIRTLDIGGDKLSSRLPELRLSRERNPALGLRSIRFSLRERSLFETQVRALLRASLHGRLRILLPLISSLSELREARAVIESVMEQLAAEGVPFNPNTELGIMIEVPSAVVMADSLAAEADFFSIGTNDLIQYSLAIDRGNEYVASMYDPLHPAVLRMISQTIEAGHRQGIEVSLCGEMAGDVFTAPVLLGLGLDELSMRPSAIPHVKRLLRHSTFARLTVLAAKVLKCKDSSEAAALLNQYLSENYPDQFIDRDERT